MTAFAYDGRTFRPVEWQSRRTLRWAAWRPDGSVALLIGNAGSAMLWNGGAELEILATGNKQNLRGAAWSPDGRTALLVGNRGTVIVLEGEAVREPPTQTTENL